MRRGKGVMLVSFPQWLAGDRASKSKVESNLEALHCVLRDMIDQNIPPFLTILIDDCGRKTEKPMVSVLTTLPRGFTFNQPRLPTFLNIHSDYNQSTSTSCKLLESAIVVAIIKA